jgi:very-short-patch-repair endonuclease
VAQTQHGLLTTGQLHALGLAGPAIHRRRCAGSLTQVHRGVYATGAAPATGLQRRLAAVLATQPHSLLSHADALWLWGAIAEPKGPPHVTAPGRRARPAITTHEAALRSDDLCALDHVPLTAPARSLLDFAAAGDAEELSRAINELRVQRLIRDSDIDEVRDRTRGHHGWKLLNRVLAAESEAGFSREELERRTIALIREAGLPSPRRNARVGHWEVDFLWPEQRLIVETDGYAVHSTRLAFERDRRKQAELQELGYEILRFTWLQVTEQPLWVAARLAARLAVRPARGRPSPWNRSGAGRA